MTYEEKFQELGRKRDEYNRIHNEGKEGYNPFEDQIAKLAEEWSDEQAKKTAEILSGQSLQIERAWFNAQKFGRADAKKANDACLARGYTMDQLFAAIRAAK